MSDLARAGTTRRRESGRRPDAPTSERQGTTPVPSRPGPVLASSAGIRRPVSVSPAIRAEGTISSAVAWVDSPSVPEARSVPNPSTPRQARETFEHVAKGHPVELYLEPASARLAGPFPQTNPLKTPPSTSPPSGSMRQTTGEAETIPRRGRLGRICPRSGHGLRVRHEHKLPRQARRARPGRSRKPPRPDNWLTEAGKPSVFQSWSSWNPTARASPLASRWSGG